MLRRILERFFPDLTVPVGASDGNPNPVKYSYNMGIAGNGAVPGRPNDTFGLGWARTELSGPFVPLLREQIPPSVWSGRTRSSCTTARRSHPGST